MLSLMVSIRIIVRTLNSYEMKVFMTKTKFRQN
jgi:hypothetical protein